jgi:hypothetical protein
MIDEFIEHGSIIGDNESRLWRVLEITTGGLVMLKFPERADLVHTRTVTWLQYLKSLTG